VWLSPLYPSFFTVLLAAILVLFIICIIHARGIKAGAMAYWLHNLRLAIVLVALNHNSCFIRERWITKRAKCHCTQNIHLVALPWGYRERETERGREGKRAMELLFMDVFSWRSEYTGYTDKQVRIKCVDTSFISLWQLFQTVKCRNSVRHLKVSTSFCRTFL
jgi:hypothetical protein